MPLSEALLEYHCQQPFFEFVPDQAAKMSSLFRAPITIVQRFFSEKMLQTSAALAFTTLLALVPMMTLILWLASTLPFFDLLVKRLDSLMVENLLPASSAGVIAAHVGRFCDSARALAAPGIAVLAVTAILLLHTIEDTFNHLWRVKPRPYWQRLRLYAFVVVVFPPLLGIIAFVSTHAITVSLGFIDESFGMRDPAFKGLSILLLSLFFSFLYYAVPNAKVSRPAALFGGLFASVMFTLMQKGFELYLANVGSYKSVYGAFSAVPIFLIWLYLSWALVLLGGLIAATVFSPPRR